MIPALLDKLNALDSVKTKYPYDTVTESKIQFTHRKITAVYDPKLRKLVEKDGPQDGKRDKQRDSKKGGSAEPKLVIFA